MIGPALDRRTLLGAAAAGAALAVAGPAAACHPRGARPVFVAGASVAGGAAQRLAQEAGAMLLRLDGRTDPMRFWSGRVAPALVEGAPLIGVTDWSDYLVFRGMGAEARLRARFEIGPQGDLTRFSASGDDPRLEALAERLRAGLAASGGGPGAARMGWLLA